MAKKNKLTRFLLGIAAPIVLNPLHVVTGIGFVYGVSQIKPRLELWESALTFGSGALAGKVFGLPSWYDRYLDGQRRKAKRRKRIGEGQATAFWAEEEDLENLGLYETKGLLLGRFPRTYDFFERWNKEVKPSPINFDQNVSDFEGNLLTIAPPGAGKGAGVVIPNLLVYPGSVVVTDPKGENYAVTANARKKLGSSVFISILLMYVTVSRLS